VSYDFRIFYSVPWLEMFSDEKWELLKKRLEKAFLFNIYKKSADDAYKSLIAHWREVFPEYRNLYRYNAVQVFPEALSHNVLPVAMKNENFYRFVRIVDEYLIKMYGPGPRKKTLPIFGACHFDCNRAGENSNAVCAGGLAVNYEVEINGNTDLTSIVRFNDGGCVYHIRLIEHPIGIPYKYRIEVNASGPVGMFSGSGYLRFTDATEDKYHLSIFSKERKWHTVDYNSKDPRIVKIEWSNHMFV